MQTHKESRITVSGEFLLYNTGGSKAILKRHYIEPIIVSHLPAVAPYLGKHGDTFTDVELLPGQSTRITFGPRELDVQEYMNFWSSAETPSQPHTLYVIGWIEYADDNGKVRRMGLCRQFDFETKRLLRHPDQDYEYDEG
jgi:hypothetical protein